MRRLTAVSPVWWIALTTLLFVLPSFDDGLVSDDFALIEESRLSGWNDVATTWTAPGLRGFYRPVPRMILGAEWGLYGLFPLGYHLLSGCIHIGVCLIWYGLLRAISIETETAMIAGLLFAVHFIHVEPVYWVSACNELLMTLFYLTSLLLAIKSTRWSRIGAGVAFALALLTKETAVTLPLVVFAYGITEANGTWRNRAMAGLRRAAPLACLLPVYAALRWYAGGSWPWSSHEVGFGVGPALILRNIAGYALQLTLPVRTLTDLYSADAYPAITAMARQAGVSPLITVVMIVAGVAACASLIAAGRRGGRWVAAGLVFGLLTAAPYLFMEGTGLRYMYLPSAGCLLTAAAALRSLRKRRSPAGGVARPAMACVAVCAALFLLAMEQARWWDQAGQTAASVLQTVRKHVGEVASDRTVMVMGIPRRIHAAYIFHNGFESAIRLYVEPRKAPVLDGDRLIERGDVVPVGASMLRLSEM